MKSILPCRVPGIAKALLVFLAIEPSSAQSPRTMVFPENAIEAAALDARAAAQRRAAAALGVSHDFRYEDRVATSGITFANRVVQDAARTYKPVHYDHGTGVAVADVDGDGHLDLYFVNQVGANALYRNRGDGTFTDITSRAGVSLAERIGVSASFADIDNDGDPDLFVTTVKMGNALFENDGRGRFRDITRSAGVGQVGHASGATFFDYDRDGLLDLFVTMVGVYTNDTKGPDGAYVGLKGAFQGHLVANRTETSILYRNLGGNRFVDVSSKVLLRDTGWSGDASISDFDGDGWPDLYVLNMQGDDHAYRNVEGRFFVETGAQLFPKTPWGSMGIKFFDFDNDGDQDLLLTDMHSDMSEHIGPEREPHKAHMQWGEDILQGGGNNLFGNAFFQKHPDGVYEERSDVLGTENYWPWGVSVGDLNADGWQDVLITSSMNYPFRYGANAVLLNDRGQRFVDTAFVVGVEPQRGSLVLPWFELDCATRDRGHVHCEEGDGRVQVSGVVGSRSSVLFDLDHDGDLDIVTNEFGAAPQVLISDLAGRAAIDWLSVRLRGRASNRDGIGATVTLVTEEGTFTQVQDGKSGYLAQSAMPLYFGLTGRPALTRIEVDWPSGTRQTVPGPIETKRIFEIVESRGEQRETAEPG